MEQDPGWPLSARSLLEAFIPQLAIRRATSDSTRPQLLVLRQVFVSFVMALVLVSVVRIVLGEMTDDPQSGLAAGIVVAVGVVSLVLSGVVKRDLDATSDATLRSSYRTRFFLRLAFAESAALVGFVVSVSIGPLWVLWIGMAFTLVGFVRLAPTTRNIEADQRRLTATGHHRRLFPALLASGGS